MATLIEEYLMFLGLTGGNSGGGGGGGSAKGMEVEGGIGISGAATIIEPTIVEDT